MPRPVVVASPPSAVPLLPNADAGSLPSPASSSACVGSASGTSAKPTGRPGSVGVGGAASAISLTKTPALASRLAV